MFFQHEPKVRQNPGCVKYIIADDTLVQGGIPNLTAPPSRRWRKVELEMCVVTSAEEQAACEEYERETGKCSRCAGCGEVVKSISVLAGTTYRPCERCTGSGKAT